MKQVFTIIFLLVTAIATAQTPVAFYPFNGNANDISGNGLNGTVNGVTLTADRFGNANSAFSFNGTSRIDVADNPSLRPANVTLSAWVYFTSTPGTQVIANKNLANSTHESYAIFFFNGNIAAAWGNASTVEFITGPVPTTSQWHFVAMTFDDVNNIGSLYLDGVLVNSQASNLTLGYDNSSFSIGTELENGSYDFFYNGIIDDVKVYNTALTTSQITTEYNTNANPLIAYYNFNNTAADFSGNNLHGTIIGSPVFTTDRNGNANSALAFNGNIANRIEVDNNPLMHTSSITIGAWVKFNSLSASHQGVVDKPMGTNVSDSWHFGTQGSNFSVWHMNDAVNINPFSQITSPINTNQWYYMVSTFDNVNKQHKLYVDGVLKTTNTFNSTIGYDNSKMYIGAVIENGALDFPMDGVVDEVKIFNKELTSAEIQQEFIASSPIQKPGSGNAVSFDGVDDHITTSAYLVPTTGDFTIDFWVFNKTNSGFREFISQGSSGDAFYIGIDGSGAMRCGDNWQTTGVTLPLNKWTQVTMIKSGTNAALYLNGIQVATQTGYSISSAGTNTLIGRQYGGLAEFPNALLDEVRIWNTALTQSQIRDRMCRKITSSDSLFNNLVAYYNFDESNGTTVFDGSLNANNGTLTNSPTRLTSGAAIGNASSHNYSGGSSATTLTNLTRGDAVTASLTSGAASGIQVYCVTENPNTTNSINTIAGNNSYFGVFAVGATNPNITATYNYNGIALNGNAENRLSLYKRNDNAAASWDEATASLDSTANTLTTSIQNGELIIGVSKPLQETITLRSGNGSIGQGDNKIKMLVGPADTYFSNAFTTTDFAAARNGSAALITQNNGAWIASLPADANAKWINDVGNPNAGSTCLFTIDFMVNGNVTNADITFNYAIDNVLGGNLNQGIYINGQALSGNTANIGGFSGQNTITRNDIASMLQQGVNTLYINASDLGGPGALIFSATINMIYNNNNPGVISASQASCVSAIPAPLTGTNAFNNSVGVTYQWQDSIANGIWTNIQGATNGDTFAPPLLSTPKYFRRLATLNNITVASNEILLDFRNAIDPSTFPINSWNVYAYNTSNIDLSGVDYRGFYSVNGLNQDTRNHWNELLSPSVANGYQGCPVNNDNFTFVLKRKGFTSGEYLLNIPAHDDGIRVLVNGVQKFEHLSCCDIHKNISLGNLDDSSVIEIRCTELTSPANVVLSFMKVTRLSDTLKGCSNVTLNGKTFSSSTTVIDTTRNAQGFDSIYTITNIIIDGFATTTNTQNFSGCNSVAVGSNVFTSSTIIRDTIRTNEGCDSIINVKNIVVTPISITTIINNVTACNSVVFRGSTITSNATIRDTLRSVQGCDSVITINNIRPQLTVNVTNNISGIDTVTFKGIVFTSNAVVKDTIKSTIGCDSIITATTITIVKVADLIVTGITAQQSSITPKNKINITWTVKNIGKANSGDGWQERISLENGNGENVYLGTAYFTNTLDSAATVTRQIEFTMPEIVTLNDSALLKIIVVPNANTTEPGFLQANNTAYAKDSIFVTKQLFIKPSTVVIEEIDATVYSGYLFRSGSRKNSETFILKSSNTSRLEVLDTTITIGLGLSGAAFQYKAKDNLSIDADNKVALFTITNANYASSSDTLIINDNELANLTISLSKDSTNEGDTLQLTIVRQVIDNLPLVVNLSSSNDNRVSYDNVITIPANQTNATINVFVNKINKPVLAEQVSFTAFANRYNTATNNIVIKQNNIPTITLEVLPASFSESAGARAAIAKVKRLGSTDIAVTLNIADNSNGELFYPSSSVTINKGESEVQFFIGVNDNSIVDNARTINLTAAVFVASCGCSVSNISNTIAAGFVSTPITILDNDGPSLNLTLSETNLPEGKTNASIITVTRNTTTTVPLTINLSSTRDSQLVYSQTVIIPVGSNKVDVPVSVPSNTINEGDRIVTFTASASGFANSSSWAIITDRTLPDATVTLMPLSFDSVFAKSSITLKSIITNEGVINIPVGTRLDFYTSTNSNANANGQLLQSFNTTKLIAPGQKDTITTTVQLPNVLGQQSVFAQVNPTQALSELSYINNFSNTLPLTFLPSYKFINVATNKAVYIKNDSIIVTGKAQALTNVSIANVAVEVYVINNQFRETYSTTTDANGNFRFHLVTLQGQLGHFSVGACYPKLGLTAEQTSFELLGLRLLNNDFIKWEINVNDTLRGSIKLINPGASVALTKLKTIVNSASVTGWTLHFDSIPNIAADDTVNLNYYITSNKPTPFNNYEQINFKVTTDEGVSLNITSYFYCRALSATLQSSVATLQTTMIKGATKLIPITIKNIGTGATGNITVSLPNVPWFSLQTALVMPSMNFGDSQIVVLKLTPLASMPANVPVVGTIAINCDQGNGLVIPFSITPVSTNKGSLNVSVEDEFTFFTAAAPKVKGALVKVSDIYTNVTIAQGVTDSIGTIKFDSIPDGFYKLNVTALQHDSYINNVLINAGEQKDIRAFLSFQAISYTWNVVPTAVKDTYNIVSTLTFVTNVPVPVVLLTMPDSIPNLNNNEIFTFKAVLTNKGLITAKNVRFTLPTDNQFEFIYNYTPTDILAQQSIQIPVLMKRKVSSARSTSPANKIVCEDLAIYYYEWQCDSIKKLKAVEQVFYIQNMICPKVLTSTIRDVSEGIAPFTHTDPINPIFHPFAQTVEPPYEYTYRSCDPCFNAMVDAIVGCSPNIPNFGNAILCSNSVQNMNISKKNAISCLINFVSDLAPVGCAMGLIDEYCICGGDGCEDINKFNNGDYGNGPLFGSSGASKTSKSSKSKLLDESMDKFKCGFVGLRSVQFWLDEVFKGIEKKKNGNDFYNQIEPFLTNKLKISDTTKSLIKVLMQRTDVFPTDVDFFVTRWNNSLDAWTAGVFIPDSLHPNIIDTFRLYYYDSLYQASFNNAKILGFDNIIDLYNTSFNTIQGLITKEKSSVCASVTVQFSQTVTMTRQAFRGTFSLFNGNTTDSVKEFKLNLVIKDDQGNIVGSQKFQTNTESISKFGNINGTGILGPKDTGTATIVFIPTKNAAPTVPKLYSFGGNLSYLDPFTGTVITRDLFPVTITVNPSPDLVLDYFVQRDILGDDPLTLPVEASIPAEFSLIINNKGFGDATDVQFTTDEPKIIDNQKGLLLNLNLVGSSLNGSPSSIGFQHLNFGNINAQSTMFGQWYFTSSLLGQFVNYDVNVTHVSSYNNPDLSLISAANIHQLVHTINVPSNDSANPIAFLSTDIPNLGNNPDAIYVTNGTKHSSFVAQNASVTVLNDSTLRLTVTPLIKGWNYKSVANPFATNKTLKNVVNENNNANVSLRNVWLTDRTLLEGQDPIYENRIHIADDVQDSIQSYILTFNAEPDKRLTVDAMTGVPDTVATIPVHKVVVHFNKAINISSFTNADVVIRCQGIVLNTNGMVINAINDSTFELDITAITVNNGYYSLTVQTNAITDNEGFNGLVGYVAGWNQFSDNLQILAVANPVVGGSINPSFAQQPFGSTIQLIAHQSIGYKFTSWNIDNVNVSFDSILNHLITSSKSITANFEKRKCILNVVADDVKGSVTGNSSGVYEFGDIISASVTKNTGYTFLGWKVNDVLVSTSPSFTFSINKDVKLEPTFKTKANPILEWNNPLVLTCSNSLQAALNATADVSGSFVYTPTQGTVLNNNSSYTLYVTFTPTDTFNFNVVKDSVFVSTNYIQVVTTSTNINSCTNVLFNGITYSSSTFVRDTLRSVQGCDSVIINTTIAITPINVVFVNDTVQGFAPLIFNGDSFLTNAIISDTIKSVQGCDSVIVKTTILITPKTTIIINNTISGCNSILFNGNVFTSSTVISDTLKSLQGNDSIITNTNIQITQIVASVINHSLSSCNQVVFNGNVFTNSIIIRDTLRSVQGCDSVIVNTTISIVPILVATHTNTLKSCTGSIVFNGKIFSTSTIVNDTLKSFQGCDSVINQTMLLISNTNRTIINDTIKGCNTVTFNGVVFSSSTVISDTIKNFIGCDSIIKNTIIDVSQPVIPSITISATNNNICSGDTVSFISNVTNGGLSQTYQWQINGVNIGSNSTLRFLPRALTTGDIITCKLTANNVCQTTPTVNSNTIQLLVNQSPEIGVTGVVSAFCTLGSVQNIYNSNTTNGGIWVIANPSIATVAIVSNGFTGAITAVANGNTSIVFKKTASNGCVSFSNVVPVIIAQVTPPNAIVGNSEVCVGNTINLSTTSTSGVWTSINNRGSISNTGIYTGLNAGTSGEVRYTVTNAQGCSAFVSKTIIVNPIPAVPNIAYATGTLNPQRGAPAGGYCVGKVFTVVGTPNVPAGAWSSTGVVSITSGGIVTINSVGEGTIKYTYTSAAGCSNSRTISGNGFACAARGVNTVDGQLSMVDDFTIYPNPAKTFISLNVETLIGKGTIIITDIYGKQIKSQPLSMGTNTVDIANLSKGMYFVSTITNEGKTTKKLIVE